MGSSNENSSLDIDSPNFNSEAYLERLLKVGSLKQIMDKENEIVTQSQYLQSEMQTLVYENYNKFISATDTVKKMRSDFKSMQNEMKQLCENMEKITKFSDGITKEMKESSNDVNRLCSTRQLLDRLQFIFLLPSQLNSAICQGKYQDAVYDYTHAQKVLLRYGGQPSFQGIQSECEEIMSKLKITLKEQLQNPSASVTELAQSADLLAKLNDDQASLEEIYLSCAQKRMQQHLDNLESSIDCCDILDWVDKGNNMLLSDLNIVVTSHTTLFPKEQSSSGSIHVMEFANSIIIQYFILVEKVLLAPSNLSIEVLVRCLDKFFRQLQALASTVSPDLVTNNAIDMVIKCINHKSSNQTLQIKSQFKESLVRVRQSLALKNAESQEKNDLKETFSSLHVYLLEKTQASLIDVILFLQKDLSFSLKSWCVREVTNACWNIISCSMTNVAELVRELTSLQSGKNPPFELLLILSKLCFDLQENGLSALNSQMVKLIEDAAPGSKVESKDPSGVALVLSSAAQTALDAAVMQTGQSLAQMLRVSVLARDWLSAPEPRGPRAVCGRLVEALVSADSAAAQLFSNGAKLSSDSSRRTLWPKAPSSSFTPINRIFSERIEVFGPSDADRVSLATGALKIALKALVECVRMRTFGRHGLQQLQVDVHYLHQRLTCMGYDERLLSALLEDALSSAHLRCVDPQLMDASIVDVICERG